MLGAEALPDAELIAILLRTGMKGRSAIEVGRELLGQFGTLNDLSRAPLEELCVVPGIGRDKAVALQGAFTLARRMAAEIQQTAPLLDSPEAVADLLREECRPYGVEHFYAILLNTRRRLLRKEPMRRLVTAQRALLALLARLMLRGVRAAFGAERQKLKEVVLVEQREQFGCSQFFPHRSS